MELQLSTLGIMVTIFTFAYIGYQIEQVQRKLSELKRIIGDK